MFWCGLNLMMYQKWCKMMNVKMFNYINEFEEWKCSQLLSCCGIAFQFSLALEKKIPWWLFSLFKI